MKLRAVCIVHKCNNCEDYHSLFQVSIPGLMSIGSSEFTALPQSNNIRSQRAGTIKLLLQIFEGVNNDFLATC